MARNYFKAVAEWEQTYLVRRSYFATELQKTVVLSLKNYLIKAKYSNSKMTAFFGKYYNKTYPQLVSLWEQEFGTTKSEDTLRGQLGALSRQLVDILGSIDAIDAALRNTSKDDNKVSDNERREAEDYLRELLTKINGLEQVDDVTGNISFAVDIQKIIDLPESESKFEISDCTSEIKLLKALSSRGIEELLSEVSAEKIGYILKVLDQPLMQTETREYTKDGKDRISYSKKVNMEKIKLLEEFEVVNPARLRAPKNSRVKEDIPVVEDMQKPAEDMPKPVEDIKPVMPVSGVAPRAELPFRFAEMSKLCEVIQKRLDDASPLSRDDEQRMRNISTLMRVFGLFTVEGLTEYLKKYIDGDITYAMKKFMKE